MTDTEKKLRDRQQDLIKILEAIDEVLKSKAWQTLKELVFDGAVDRLDRQLLSEAKKPSIEVDKIYQIQGELVWARRYSDLKSYAEMLSSELLGIKEHLK